MPVPQYDFTVLSIFAEDLILDRFPLQNRQKHILDKIFLDLLPFLVEKHIIVHRRVHNQPHISTHFCSKAMWHLRISADIDRRKRNVLSTLR